jgi:4-hydroxybenzoate polyprenyltransferase
VWRAWLEQLRPACWLLFLTHGYLGFIMGARAPLPAWDRFALDQRIWEWLAEGRDFWLALICLGPLLGGFSLLLDDLYDYETDRRNPRRCTLPTVQGILSSRTVRRVAWGQAGAGLLLALAISPVFFVLAGIGGALGWAYAAEPWRTKSRAGWDVVTNALGGRGDLSVGGMESDAAGGRFPVGLGGSERVGRGRGVYRDGDHGRAV